MTPKLTPIGHPIRSTAKRPGLSTTHLRGPTVKQSLTIERTPRVVRVQIYPGYTHNKALQCAPGDEVPQLFSAYWPGIDHLTGKPWRDRA